MASAKSDDGPIDDLEEPRQLASATSSRKNPSKI